MTYLEGITRLLSGVEAAIKQTAILIEFKPPSAASYATKSNAAFNRDRYIAAGQHLKAASHALRQAQYEIRRVV